MIESKSCCRCSKIIEPGQEVFDTDSCAHHVCVDCRFSENLICSVCNPHHQKEITPLNHEVVDVIPTMFLKDFAICMKRKKVTTDHIVNLECKF